MEYKVKSILSETILARVDGNIYEKLIVLHLFASYNNTEFNLLLKENNEIGVITTWQGDFAKLLPDTFTKKSPLWQNC